MGQEAHAGHLCRAAARSSARRRCRRGQQDQPPTRLLRDNWVCQVSPNSRNTIPGRVSVDFRHPDDAVLTAMDKELREACAAAAASQSLEAEVKEFWYFPPTPFDASLVGAVRAAAQVQGYKHQDIVSGAGHDAVYLARVAPSAMIFVPCVGGISHNEIEDAKPADLTAGCNVLLNALLESADAARGD
jgi:N-carbamoyl-L-amino-acid hydrolase